MRAKETAVYFKKESVRILNMETAFLTDVPMSEYTTYKIGGPAKYFAEALNKADIANILDAYNKRIPGDKKTFILGGGANVLFPDEPYNGLVLKISISGIELLPDNILRIGAGAKLADVVQFAAEHNLSGIEWAAGIPGSFGGAIRGNAGAFGGEIKDSVLSVTSVDRKDISNPIIRKNSGDLFGYRTSAFKLSAKEEIIIEAEIKLVPGRTGEIREKMDKNIKTRKERQPVEWPSAGSIFKNIDVSKITETQKKEWASLIKLDPIPVLPVAFLLSEAGLKGETEGGIQISEKHPNFFINIGEGKSRDVKKLITLAKKKVKEKFEIKLEEEIQIVE